MITLFSNPSTSTTSSTTHTYTILSLVLNYVELIIKYRIHRDYSNFFVAISLILRMYLNRGCIEAIGLGCNLK
jgi:hypothetical protein